MDLPQWGRLLAVGVIASVIWWLVRSKPCMRIVVDSGRVLRTDGFPRHVDNEVADYFTNAVTLHGKVTILISRGPDSRLKIDYRGPVDPGTRQQIRNFLTTIL